MRRVMATELATSGNDGARIEVFKLRKVPNQGFHAFKFVKVDRGILIASAFSSEISYYQARPFCGKGR